MTEFLDAAPMPVARSATGASEKGTGARACAGYLLGCDAYLKTPAPGGRKAGKLRSLVEQLRAASCGRQNRLTRTRTTSCPGLPNQGQDGQARYPSLIAASG